VLLGLSAILFALPLFLAVIFQSGFLKIANENLAYRYFFHERLAQGEAIYVGVGYLTTLLQAPIYHLVNSLPGLDTANLFIKLDAFCLMTMAFVTLLMWGLLWMASKMENFGDWDRLMIAIVAVAPLYGEGFVGWDYYLMSEYYLVNMFLYALIFFIFVAQWRRKTPDRAWELLAMGVLAGAIVSNRITLLLLASLMFLPFCDRIWKTGRVFDWRFLLPPVGIVIGFLGVHWLVYVSQPASLPVALSKWLQFILHPGAQYLGSAWVEVLFREFRAIIIVILVALAILCWLIACRHRRGLDVSWWIYAVCGLGLAGYFSFIVKYPATSSLFDACSSLLVVGFVGVTCLAFNQEEKATLKTVPIYLFFMLIAFSSVDFWTISNFLKGSRIAERLSLNNVEKLRKLAGEEPIIVVFPGNEYHHEGYIELLLKAACDFPTWDITKGQKNILDHYWPNLSIRHGYSGPSPNLPYPKKCVIVWFSSADYKSLPGKYPVMKEAVANATRVASFCELPKGGAPLFTMHAALLEDHPIDSGPLTH